jgi:hypothetical protein
LNSVTERLVRDGRPDLSAVRSSVSCDIGQHADVADIPPVYSSLLSSLNPVSQTYL